MAAPAPAMEPAAASAGRSPSLPQAEKSEISKTAADERWKPVLDLQCELTVDLSMPDFKIGDLLKLRRGSVITARLRLGLDVPLRLNGAQIGWIEFEMVGERLAVRLTELA